MKETPVWWGSNTPTEYAYQSSIVPPPDMGNRVAVGRPRTYRDRDRERSTLSFNAVLPYQLKLRLAWCGRQTDITKAGVKLTNIVGPT